MNILKSTEIIRREWENIRVSLERCGDIGELSFEEKSNRAINGITSDLRFLRNAVEMKNKYPTYGYFSHEAAYVFTVLATRAGKSLGLRNDLSRSFGSGYSIVRTGWLELYITEEKSIVKQWLFFKLFSQRREDFTWDFSSLIVKKKLKRILDKFLAWQEDPSTYFHDIRSHKTKLEEFERSLSLVLSYPGEVFSHNLEELRSARASTK